MNTIPTLLAILAMVSVAAAGPKLTGDKVSRIGELILAEKAYEAYTDSFRLKNPTFDPEQKIWTFANTNKGGGFPGDSRTIFEIRDSDGYYRFRVAGGFVAKSSLRFRMSPRLRKRITVIIRN